MGFWNWLIGDDKLEEQMMEETIRKTKEEAIRREKEEKEEKEKEEELKKKKPKEVFEVSVEGFVRFDIVVKEQYYSWESPIQIKCSYNALSKFLGKELRSTGTVFIRLDEYEEKNPHLISWGNADTLEEKGYLALIEMLERDESYIMDNVKGSLAYDIKEHIQKERIKELKEQLENNKKLDFNFKFQMEKDR